MPALPAAFPTYDLSASNPRPTVCYQLAPSYAVSKSPEFQDGSCDYNLDAETPTRRWRLSYKTATQAEATILDNHHASAFHDALGFDFTDPNDGTLYSDVHYASYERSHEKRRVQVREIELVRYP